jgi:hypothetical protein
LGSRSPGLGARLEAGAGGSANSCAAPSSTIVSALAVPHFFFLRPFSSRVKAGGTIIYASMQHVRRGFAEDVKDWCEAEMQRFGKNGTIRIMSFTASPNASRTNAGTYETNCSSFSSLSFSPECHHPCPHTLKGATIHRHPCLFWPEKMHLAINKMSKIRTDGVTPSNSERGGPPNRG